MMSKRVIFVSLIKPKHSRSQEHILTQLMTPLQDYITVSSLQKRKLEPFASYMVMVNHLMTILRYIFILFIRPLLILLNEDIQSI